MGVSRDCPFFSCTPYYLWHGKSYSFQIWLVHSEGPSEQKPIKNFREKGALTYPGTVQFFRVPPIISGTAKAAIFKFCTHIYRHNRNKSPLKISWKVAVGIVRDSQKFSWHPDIWRIARSSLRQLSFLVNCEIINSENIHKHYWSLHCITVYHLAYFIKISLAIASLVSFC